MDKADEMRELREVGGQSAIDKENKRLDAEIEKIARSYRAVDTAIRMMKEGEQNE